MRRPLAVLALTISLLSGPAAGAATASTTVALPLVPARSANELPPGFTATAAQAIAAAEATRTMQALHRRQHPLTFQAFVWNARRWYVDFAFHGRLVAEVDVSASGRVAAVWTGPLALAVYARGHFAPLFSSPWVLIPFSLLFLVPFWRRRRRGWWVSPDALVILSLLVSYVLFVHARLDAAVWLVYPPLIVLLVRMLHSGLRRHPREPPAVLTTALSPRVLWGGLLVLVIARVALSLAHSGVIDVGYSSVIGAHRLIHGQSLYYAAAAHSDTYGPLMYLAYAPFELVFPWHGVWDTLPAAHAATIVFDLVTILGLVLLGRRLAPGTAGRRLGVLLAWAWAACPFTLLGVIMHTNDGFVAMLAVLSLLAFSSAPGRGALLGLSAGAKFFAAALLPLYAAGIERTRRAAIACVGGFILAIGVSVALVLPGGGLGRLYHEAVAFQLHRADVFSAWSLHPGLNPVKIALDVIALGLALAVALLPQRRALPAVCALAAALTIALQLPSTHWFYYYAVWFLPYVFVAVLTPSAPDPTGPGADATSGDDLSAVAALPERQLTPA